MTKKALLFGCGSKWGLEFSKTLSLKNYSVDLVSSSNVEHDNINCIKVDWFTLDRNSIKKILNENKDYDLIFFNHNSGGAPNDHFLKPGNEMDLGSWNYSFWINCQLPYVIIHHLSKNIKPETKIGWMLTGLIDGHNPDMFQYAGYASVKSTNLHLMRGFSQFHQGIFFAINPWQLSTSEYQADSKKILSIIEKLTISESGKTFNKDGYVWI